MKTLTLTFNAEFAENAEASPGILRTLHGLRV